ncbi:MAG: AmmeMemoRadiSam system protein B, partial [bacterium]|nr:AmmeMemoRadiSam system protein B [bacterium]
MMENVTSDIRKPAVAGTFYPGNSIDLIKELATMFSEVEKTALADRPLALVSPHAGYPYSGKVAAKAYKLLEGEEYDTVVVISPSHTVFFKGCSVYTGGGYQTPIALVETDHDLANAISSINPLVYASNMGHATGASRGEHALEVQLPFLQVVLGKFKLVAVVMGDQEEDSIFALGEVLASTLKGTNSLIVASTDLSHFHQEKEARKLDHAVQTAIENFDAESLIETLSTGKGEACGGGPVAATMLAARRLGGSEVRFLDYSTSGSTTGDFSEVVGYLSAAIVSGKKTSEARQKKERAALVGVPLPEPTAEVLSEEDRVLLHSIARDAIGARLKDQKYLLPERESLEIQRGVFVTLKIDGELRGCIGLIKAREPLNRAVSDMATAAAFDDPRFPQLTRDEYDRLEYEISVLSPLKRVKELSEIKIGRDGLMIKLDMNSGLLLPQVASEYDWTVKEFVEQTCLKAGLPRESYKDRFAEVY